MQKAIATRKMDSLASLFVYNLMHDKDLKLNGPVFWGVAEYFQRRVTESHVDPMKINNVYVTGDELQLLGGDLQSMGDAVVATHKDGTLTVRQLVEALSVMPGSLRPRVRTPQNLKDAIGGIVRNQYLLKEAEKQGLANDLDVMREYSLQRDETLASAYYGRRRGEVRVSPPEVEEFKKHSPVSEEQVFFKFNMASLARDAKVDSVLRVELPGLKSKYGITVDTTRIRSLCPSPDGILEDQPIRVYIREIFM
jgi:hypothetical protein